MEPCNAPQRARRTLARAELEKEKQDILLGPQTRRNQHRFANLKKCGLLPAYDQRSSGSLPRSITCTHISEITNRPR